MSGLTRLSIMQDYELHPDTIEERRQPSLRGYDAKQVSDNTSVDTGSENLTQQHLGPEVDVNTIVRRFGITRVQPSGPAGGVYGDFTGIEDYDSALAAVERARGGFMALPADIRERFRNDAGVYLRYVDELSDEELERAFPSKSPAPGAAPSPAPVPPSEGSGSAAT